MGNTMIQEVQLTPLKQIHTESGGVLHALKSSESSYANFGEAYFSIVHQGHIKGWKRHRSMHSNLIVPVGLVRFILFDDRTESDTCGLIQEVNIGTDNYQRLTIPRMIWFAFQGIEPQLNLILNVASIEHDPQECDVMPLETDSIPFNNWER